MPRYNDGCNLREIKATKLIVENGLQPREALKLAGYSESTINNNAGKFLKRESVVKSLELAGLTDRYLHKTVKKIIRSGNKNINNVPITPDILTRNIEMVYRMKGYLSQDKEDNNTTNITKIKELKILNIQQLLDKVEDISKDIDNLNNK